MHKKLNNLKQDPNTCSFRIPAHFGPRLW